MTCPTLLGSGGHQALDTSYGTSSGPLTYYSNVGLGRCPLGPNALTDESRASQIIRVPGAVSYLSWGVDMDFGATVTLALKENSSDTDLAVSICAGMTGTMTDSTHSVGVVAGDALDFAATVDSPTVYTGGFYCMSARFDADTASAQLLACVGPMSLDPPSTTRQYGNFLGFLEADPTQSNQQFQCLAAGSWQNMACYVASNDFDGTVTVSNRIDTGSGPANGSMAISVSSNFTGYFEDTDSAHSDSVNAGDLLCYGFSGSGGAGKSSCPGLEHTFSPRTPPFA